MNDAGRVEDLKAGPYERSQTTGSSNYIQPFV